MVFAERTGAGIAYIWIDDVGENLLNDVPEKVRRWHTVVSHFDFLPSFLSSLYPLSLQAPFF